MLRKGALHIAVLASGELSEDHGLFLTSFGKNVVGLLAVSLQQSWCKL